MSRLVYDNASAERPKPTPAAEQVARGEQPIDEKIVKARTDLIITKLDDTLASYKKGDSVPGTFFANFQKGITTIKNNANTLITKIRGARHNTDETVRPIIKKALPPAAPVYDADGLQLTPAEIASGALKYDVNGLQEMDSSDITDEHLAAFATLKKTEALIANPNGPLKGKVTLSGFQNYIRAGSGIAGDILATSKDQREYYGTLTFTDLTTQDVIISSPQLTVTAIKVLQQNLGLKADGIFGLATYDAIIKRHPTIAAMLRDESPLKTV